jgi:hypothetical protein
MERARPASRRNSSRSSRADGTPNPISVRESCGRFRESLTTQFARHRRYSSRRRRRAQGSSPEPRCPRVVFDSFDSWLRRTADTKELWILSHGPMERHDEDPRGGAWKSRRPDPSVRRPVEGRSSHRELGSRPPSGNGPPTSPWRGRLEPFFPWIPEPPSTRGRQDSGRGSPGVPHVRDERLGCLSSPQGIDRDALVTGSAAESRSLSDRSGTRTETKSRRERSGRPDPRASIAAPSAEHPLRRSEQLDRRDRER